MIEREAERAVDDTNGGHGISVGPVVITLVS